VRALIVDDSRAIRTILGQILRSVGFEVVEAGNGQEGLAKLAEVGSADLAMVDWNMPVMDGLAFVQAARAIPIHDPMRIVMVTTETDMARMVRAMDEGANEYIMKPFTRDMIVQKLEIVGMTISP
jgi:two-component system chemotaxis response regulator CheY